MLLLSVIFYCVSDLLLFLSRVHFSICHLSGQIGLIDRRLESKDGKLHQHTSERQRIQVRVRRWTLGSAESGSLRMGKPKRAEVLASPCHTRSSVRFHQMRTCSGYYSVDLWSLCPLPAAALAGLGC